MVSDKVLLTLTLARAIDSCNRLPEPRNGSLPESKTCNITPAPQTSHGFPYCRLETTSGAK